MAASVVVTSPDVSPALLGCIVTAEVDSLDVAVSEVAGCVVVLDGGDVVVTWLELDVVGVVVVEPVVVEGVGPLVVGNVVVVVSADDEVAVEVPVAVLVDEGLAGVLELPALSEHADASNSAAERRAVVKRVQ